ncbi:polymer-forming cytoskeletal protein [candidate division KSB1 bacterium]
MKNEKTERIKPSDVISTVIGRGTRIKGSIHIRNSGRIDGHVEGGVVSDQDVVIGEGGVIEGSVISKTAIIGGKVLGEVNASKKVILEEKAELQGDIHSQQIKVSDGAVFNGYCYMLKEREVKQLPG